MAVVLRPMLADEFAEWLPRARDEYVGYMVGYEWVEQSAARAKADRDTEALFPGGVPSAEQLVFVVEADGERVGELWVGERHGELRRSLFVWNIHIDEAHRGRGLGRETMLLAENEARRRGLSYIALEVSGANTTARRLYGSLGYRETIVFLEKQISQARSDQNRARSDESL